MNGIPEEDYRKHYEAKGIIVDQPPPRVQRLYSDQNLHGSMVFSAPYAAAPYAGMAPPYFMPPSYAPASTVSTVTTASYFFIYYSYPPQTWSAYQAAIAPVVSGESVPPVTNDLEKSILTSAPQENYNHISYEAEIPHQESNEPIERKTNEAGLIYWDTSKSIVKLKLF